MNSSYQLRWFSVCVLSLSLLSCGGVRDADSPATQDASLSVQNANSAVKGLAGQTGATPGSEGGAKNAASQTGRQ